jgi:hypothetical protein
MFSAQRPDRFVGTVQIAGNELVSVALRPDRYELRQTSGRGNSQGFYAGAPSPCAIAALIGVSMEPTALVSMLLGDAPVIVMPSQGEPDPVQRWERSYPGHELLILEGDTLRQELRFRWIAGAWHFAGTSVQQREDDRWRRVFRTSHRDFESFGGRQLATRIDITSDNGEGGPQTLKIHLLDVVLDPDSLVQRSATADPEATAQDQPVPFDRWDEDWHEQDEDEGGSDEPPTSQASTSDDTPEVDAEIPEIFFLSPAGLRSRGDLCRDQTAAP